MRDEKHEVWPLARVHDCGFAGRTKMLRVLVLLLGVVMLTGCVSTKMVPLQPGRAATLQGRTLTVTHREKPDFSAVTAGKAMFGLIGAAGMVVAGNRIVEQNAVEDPAGSIASELAAELASAHAMTVVPTKVVTTSWSSAELAKQYSGADILLDVQTVNWSFVYFPSDFNNYRVIYSAKLRLIDTKNRKVLAEGFCARVPEKSDDAPGYEELLADQAARLKQELKAGGDQCIAEFRARVLLLSAANAAQGVRTPGR